MSFIKSILVGHGINEDRKFKTEDKHGWPQENNLGL